MSLQFEWDETIDRHPETPLYNQLKAVLWTTRRNRDETPRSQARCELKRNFERL
jgi:hypothetical protein